MHHMDINETHRENVRKELHKNTACCLEKKKEEIEQRDKTNNKNDINFKYT